MSHYVNTVGYPHTIDNKKNMYLQIHEHLENTSGHMIPMKVHTSEVTIVFLFSMRQKYTIKHMVDTRITPVTS